MKKHLNKNLFTAVILALCTITLGTYIAIAAPQQANASVSTPALRGSYVNNNNVRLEGDITLSKGDQIISVSLRDSDVKQVLRMFADKAGLNIIFHSSVEGEVTLDLVNITLNDAFKMIMQMSELSYVIDNDTLMVMSAEASQELNVSKENMSIIPVKYIDASKIADFLNKNIFSINKPGLSNSDIVITNPIKNELLVFGTDNDYRMAKKIVDKLDTKPLMTTYKVNHTTPKEMADLICDTLFAASTSSEDGEGDTANSSDDSDEITLGGGVVACTISGSGSNDSESSGSSASGQSDNTASGLSSLDLNNMSIVYKPALGTITMVGGTPHQIVMVNDFITTNDKKQPQAYIEFSIVELNEEGSKELNNSWDIWSKNFSASFGSSGLVTNPLYPSFWKGSANPDSSTIAKYTGPLTISQSISYLITNGKGRVLANPKVVVTNGKKSTIDLTSDYIESTTSQVLQTGTGTGAIQRTYTIGEDNGIKIELTPFISPDGYVSMNLKPDYATIKQQITDLGADGVTPIIGATLLQRRNLDLSNVRIKDGETLVIGGMIQESETQSITKVPILGDIPIIGTFFRNQTKKTSKEELVIMITPRIIKDTEDVARI